MIRPLNKGRGGGAAAAPPPPPGGGGGGHRSNQSALISELASSLKLGSGGGGHHGSSPNRGGSQSAPSAPASDTRARRPFKGRPDLVFFSPVGGAAPQPQHQQYMSGNSKQRSGETGLSSFASGVDRFDDKTASMRVAPPPGAYSPAMSWKAPSVVPFSSGPKDRIPDVKLETDVGPGSYNLRSTVQANKSRNRKNIMVTTQARFKGRTGEYDGPGPGEYMPEYAYGNLIKPTFNIAIAENSGFL